MNTAQYIHLLNNASEVNNANGAFLDEIVQQYPFLQSAHAIRLKNLYAQESFQYNQYLRKTAAYTADRNVLFDFITSTDFIKDNNNEIDYNDIDNNEQITKQTDVKPLVVSEELPTVLDQSVTNTTLESNVIKPYQAQKLENSIRNLITNNLVESYADVEFVRKDAMHEEIIDDVESRLELGKPLAFSAAEKHSFQEWLHLASFKPIETAQNEVEINTPTAEVDYVKQKKIDLIDKFIAANPKISSVKTYVTPSNVMTEAEDNSSIMTETLAKVYLEQKKYQKAIQAYEILILKYPEKFSFFANRIADIKSLQQNNN